MKNLTCASATTFHLTVLLLHSHVQRRQHQRQRPLSIISIPHPNINLNWQYENTLDIEKTNAYLSSMIDTVHKNLLQSSCKKRNYIEHVYLYFKTPSLCADIKSNQIKSLLLSHHHSTSALVSEILKSVLQTVQKKQTIYIWTVHIYRLYRRQCAKYTYIYSVHIVYYKDILSYQLHIIHRMGTSTLCTLSIHYVVYT